MTILRKNLPIHSDALIYLKDFESECSSDQSISSLNSVKKQKTSHALDIPELVPGLQSELDPTTVSFGQNASPQLDLLGEQDLTAEIIDTNKATQVNSKIKKNFMMNGHPIFTKNFLF